MPLLVDFRLHFLPRSFYHTIAEASAAGETADEILRRAAAAADVVMPPENAESLLGRWMEEMDRYGVHHAVLQCSLPAAAEEVTAAVRAGGGRVSALLAIDPLRQGTLGDAAERLDAGTHRGFLLYPGQHGYALDGPELAPFLHLLATRRLPAVVHCGLAEDPVPAPLVLPHRRGAAPLSPLDLVAVARAYPAVPFVLPDFGGGLLREALLVGQACPNVHLATGDPAAILATEPHRPGPADVFDRLLGVFGLGRILFASGSAEFPPGWRHHVFTTHREALGACGLPEADRQRILGGNALRLLGLPSAPPAP